MLIYILKRIALMLPTLLGALTITFVVVQFVPGGPVEQIMAEARAGSRRHRAPATAPDAIHRRQAD
jgi:microcin C transport system permease protein